MHATASSTVCNRPIARTIAGLLSVGSVFVLMLALAGCVAPKPGAGTPDAPRGAPAPTATPAAPPAPAPASPVSTREEVATAESPAPVKVDVSCKTDADCTVKNVGNCCGYYPACVNVNSPTDPKGVQAECAKSGMMSVCGWQEISGCSCKQGKCEAGPAQALR